MMGVPVKSTAPTGSRRRVALKHSNPLVEKQRRLRYRERASCRKRVVMSTNFLYAQN